MRRRYILQTFEDISPFRECINSYHPEVTAFERKRFAMVATVSRSFSLAGSQSMSGMLEWVRTTYRLRPELVDQGPGEVPSLGFNATTCWFWLLPGTERSEQHPSTLTSPSAHAVGIRLLWTWSSISSSFQCQTWCLNVLNMSQMLPEHHSWGTTQDLGMCFWPGEATDSEKQPRQKSEKTEKHRKALTRLIQLPLHLVVWRGLKIPTQLNWLTAN